MKLEKEQIMKNLILLLLLFSICAHARIQPEEGLWDDPNRPGRGVTIELQNGVLVATYFGYDQEGNDQWWQGVAFEGPESTWSGTFNALRDGQCIGCSYQFPSLNEAESIGEFSIDFNTTRQATLTWADGVETIQKSSWGFATPLDFLLGAWTFNGFTVDDENDYGLTVNNVVFRFDGIVEFEGELYAVGNYSGFGGDFFPVAARYIGEFEFGLGSFIEAGSLVSIVYQSDLAGINFMRFDMLVNENKAEGAMTVFTSSNPPPAPGGSVVGFLRAAGAKFIDKYEKELLFGTISNKSEKVEKYLPLVQYLK